MEWSRSDTELSSYIIVDEPGCSLPTSKRTDGLRDSHLGSNKKMVWCFYALQTSEFQFRDVKKNIWDIRNYVFLSTISISHICSAISPSTNDIAIHNMGLVIAKNDNSLPVPSNRMRMVAWKLHFGWKMLATPDLLGLLRSSTSRWLGCSRHMPSACLINHLELNVCRLHPTCFLHSAALLLEPLCSLKTKFKPRRLIWSFSPHFKCFGNNWGRRVWCAGPNCCAITQTCNST